jgi:hypothetical protein
VDIVRNSLEWLGRTGRRLGPYVMLEVLMPGGTMLALLLFLYRRWQSAGAKVNLPLEPAR